MTLVLEIEYLAGIAFAAQSPDSAIPDWPPQPDRVFSALVAAWGAHGEKADESDALEWLEEQPTPTIAASAGAPRTAATVYVPPNDFEIPERELNKQKWYRDFLAKGMRPPQAKAYTNALGVIPEYRQRKERMFPAMRPYDPIVRLYWNEANPDAEVFLALGRLAANTAYLGHSSSLTRCHFFRSEEPTPAEAKPAQRQIYKNRFCELRRDYRRFVESGGKTGRPRPGNLLVSIPEHEQKTLRSCFSCDWLVLEHTDGEMPDIRAAALIAKEIRSAILSGYQQNGRADRIPSIVSGHTFDGNPTLEPHLAIIPLAFTGFPHADGHLLGFALVPPRYSDLLKDIDFLQAIRKVAPLESKQGRRALRWSEAKESMCLRRFGLKLSPTFDPSKRSLAPELYTRAAQVFATVTPIVLDRHLKGKEEEREAEVVTLIKSACRNIGLPEPVTVVPDKHSAIEGASSAQPSGLAPEWMRWRAPASLSSRAITHAVIRFTDPITGPVILGAGRFIGLGLCRPIDGAEGTA